MKSKDFKKIFKNLKGEKLERKAQEVKEKYMTGEIYLYDYQLKKVCELANTGRGGIAFDYKEVKI